MGDILIIRKYKKILYIILCIFIVSLGMGMLFNKSIINFINEYNTNRNYNSLNVKPQNFAYKAQYNENNVNSPNIINSVKGTYTKDNLASRLVIPSLNMKLPVYYGMSNTALSNGAGTMKPNQRLGANNYAIAGHYMTYKGTLFSPLKNIKKGTPIFMSDGKYLYIFRVKIKKVVNNTQTQWVNNYGKYKLITLITCDSSKIGTKKRLVVRGALEKVELINSQNRKIIFNK